MKVDCLSPDDSWELFRNTVGEIALRRHEDIPNLARKVAEKCCGLPLALNVIGKAMAYKEDVHEWGHAIEVLSSSSHEFPGMEEKILSILKFSYDGLEDEKLKSCFLYCSLFPEDYKIKKERLIEYWIGEGFISVNRDKYGSNNQGHAIIGSLVRAHLLMDGELTTVVKMHDVVREMALWIGSNLGDGEKNWVKSGAQLRCIPKEINWKVVRRISLMNNHIEHISSCPDCPNLSTLLLGGNRLKSISGEFFRFMKALVVLDLSRNEFLHEVPEEICSLSSLECLNLSSTKTKLLPVGLKGLEKLISLDLEFATGISRIDGIGTSLPNLQVLKLFFSHVYVDAALMEELKLLEDLKILTANIEDALILESIQGVDRLASCIRGLCLVGMSAEVVILNTVALAGLQQLCLFYCTISEIKINSPGFKHLFSVNITCLKRSKDLTWLLFAQNLRFLKLANSESIEEIINTEKGMSISTLHSDMLVPFGKLESLILLDLFDLKIICSNFPSLPSLREFVAKNCPNLPPSFRDMNINNGGGF